MKIYTVMHAPFTVSDSEDAMVFTSTYFKPEAFICEAEAVECAEEFARSYRGHHVWIIEGVAKESFHCEPEPVLKGKPLVQRMG